MTNVVNGLIGEKIMTKNQTKADDYLRKIQTTENNLKKKRDELEALRYKASGAGAIRYDKDRVQTSPKDYLSMAIDDIIEIEKQIEEDEAAVEKTKGQAYAVVRQMEQPDHRAIIEWYYLNGLPMQMVSIKMNMSERNAYYLRDDALEEYGKIMG